MSFLTRIFASRGGYDALELDQVEARKSSDVAGRISLSDPDAASPYSVDMTAKDPDMTAGQLSFEEDAAGGMGRHLGVFSCTLLIVGRIIGTGIFSTPSSILFSVGSVGVSLTLWVLGFILSFCGLFVWLEYGTMFPRSGGEKVYLEAVWTRPRYLATTVFATYALLMGYTSSGCIAFASNILVTLGRPDDLWAERGIAVAVIVFVTVLHGFAPRSGIHFMNALSVCNVLVLLFVVLTGWAVLAGKTAIPDPHANFRGAFTGGSVSSSSFAAAMFKVIQTYSGWTCVNYVLNDVRDPVRTLRIAGPLGLGICAVLYIFANVAYFAAVTKQELVDTGVTVASLFFRNVFGERAQRALTVFVAISALGSIMTGTYAFGRLNQELAKEGIPLPFNKFWASNWPTNKSPFPGLLIHLASSVVVILAPPRGIAYPFILDVSGYPQQIVNLFVIVGLFWLRWAKPNVARPFKMWWPFGVFFLMSTAFLIFAPFIRPPGGIGDTPPLPYYLYCLVGIAVLLLGVLVWAGWRKVLPWLFAYELVATKEELDDGTVVTVVSPAFPSLFGLSLSGPSKYAHRKKRGQESAMRLSRDESVERLMGGGYDGDAGGDEVQRLGDREDAHR